MRAGAARARKKAALRKKEKANSPGSMTIIRKFVPHRGCSRDCALTLAVVRGSLFSRQQIASCSAPWYSKTRRREHQKQRRRLFPGKRFLVLARRADGKQEIPHAAQERFINRRHAAQHRETGPASSALRKDLRFPPGKNLPGRRAHAGADTSGAAHHDAFNDRLSSIVDTAFLVFPSRFSLSIPQGRPPKKSRKKQGARPVFYSLP